MLRELRRQVRERSRSEQAGEVDSSAHGPSSAEMAPDGQRRAPQAHGDLGPTLARPILDTDQLLQALERARAVAPGLAASLERLDPWQQAAVVSDAPALLVRAQVGSGKTAVLAHRVLWLHQIHGIPLEQLAVVTFTNHAAGQLIERVQSLLSHATDPKAFRWFGTLHGLGRTLLAETLDPQLLGWRPGFAVLDQHTRQELWQRLIKDHGLQIKYPNRLADRLRKLASTGSSLSGNMARDDHLERLAQLYVEAKKQQNAMDFDDLIEASADLLARAAEPLPLQALLVDELQDCEPREVELLWALRQPQTRFFAVGDPNQSIYAWRGSTPRIFEQIQRAWQCQQCDLPNNYRSTPEILAAARAVLGKAASEGQLAATRAGGAPVGVRQFHDPHLEALALATRFKALQQQGVPWNQIAVLARTRKQIEVLRVVLQDQQVPCADSAQGGWDERPAALWMLRQILHSQGPDAEVIRAALTDAHRGWLTGRSVGPAALVKALKTGDPPWELLQRMVRPAKGPLPGDPRDVALAERWIAALRSLPECAAFDGEALEQALPHLWLRPTHRDYARDLRHVQSAQSQLAHAFGVVGQWPAAAAAVLAEGPRDPQALQIQGVRLLTLHAAKGLEFQHVVVSGCNQGVVPLAGAYGDPAQLAEERRLLFVGLTRGRDQVEITWHTRPVLPQALPQPSDWLLGIPAAACNWSDVGASWNTAPQAQEHAQPNQEVDRPSSEAIPMTEPRAIAPWQPGQAVSHAKYGSGKVLRCDGFEVVAEFGRLGEKTFSLLLCPLTSL
jgi:DNA helicase-2/ATP-dependent DNA helicase PcrA